MKRILAILMLGVLAIVLAACSSQAPSNDPLVAKWVTTYNDGNSKILFSFEEVGDLDVTIWNYSEAEETLVQAEDYAGSYTADKENGTITYTVDGEKVTFGYSLVENTSITFTFEETELTLNYVESNNSAK